MALFQPLTANAADEPDFAYPQTVLGDARAELRRADGLPPDSASAVRLRALLEIVVASGRIDRDSTFAMPGLIAEQAAAPANSAAGRAMLKALQASVLTRIIYQRRSWAYDRVDVPAGPAPVKVSLWGKDNFSRETAALYDSALAICRGHDAPLASFASSVNVGPDAMKYVPDVSGFIRSLAVSDARAYGDSERAQALVAQALEDSAPDSAPHIYWLLLRDRGESQALLADYEANKRLEPARLLLLEYTDDGGYENMEEPEEAQDAYETRSQAKLRAIRLIEESLEAFPDWVANDRLRDVHRRLTAPWVSMSSPRLAPTEQPCTLKIEYWYADSLSVDVYRLTPGYKPKSARSICNDLDPVHTLRMRPTSIYGRAELTFEPEQTGRYLLMPFVNDTTGDDYNRITVTPMLPVNVSVGNSNAIVAANFNTGEPMRGIKVFRNYQAFRSGEKTSSPLGKTDRHGVVRYDSEGDFRGSQWLSFEVDGQPLSFDQDYNVYSISASERDSADRVTFITDRALYHPGDTVRFAAILSRSNGIAGAVLGAKTIEVSLMDANSTNVGQCSLTTDALGRACGSFSIPDGLLSGAFSLRAAGPDGFLGSGSFTVSDFRLPTVFVENTAVERDAPSAGAVTLRGIVKTYSGMPVGGARIDVQVSRAMRWWAWFRGTEEIGRLEGTTQPDGTYEIAVPADMLNQNPEFNNFVAKITATTANAETSANFTTGKPLLLSTQPIGNVNAAAGRPTATVNAFNPEGENQPVALRWQLMRPDSAIVCSGTATAGTPFEMDVAAAGRYTLTVEAADSTLADKATFADFVTVYNTATDDVPDTGNPYFLPKDKVGLRRGRASLTVGTTLDKATLFVATGCDGALVAVKPYTLRRGFTDIEVEVPEGESATIQIFSVRAGSVYEDRIVIERPAQPVFTVETESFRDRLVPGQRETWRLRVRCGDSAVEGAAMVATMFNGALNALTSYSMPAGFGLYTPSTYISVRHVFNRSSHAFATIQSAQRYGGMEWMWPRWRFLADGTYATMTYFTGAAYGARSANSSMKMAAVTGAAPGVAAPEAAEVEDDLVMADTADLSEEVASASESEEDGGEGRTEAEQAFSYRDGEILQAFFMPQLVSSEDGTVEIVFEVPNANGTWSLNAFAWTQALQAGRLSALAVSSKPVMVQPNLPRFLRQGDRCRLGATVFNNTDSVAEVATVVEIFNPATGEVTASETFSSTVAAAGSAIVNIEVEAPTDAAAIGYRVRSTAGAYSDGEQNAIPVLPSEAVVVESTEFYLNPGQQPEVLDIVVHPETAYTLQYVSNPIWTVVKAMRGLGQGSRSTTANGLVSGLYSVLAASRIANDNPAIRSAYEEWVANPTDGALESMLSRNSGLKTLMLDQTPWVQAAASNTDRMAQLGRIFDREEVAKALAERLKGLRDLHGAEGGFAWYAGANEASVWASRTVLLTLGIAREQGMLGSDSAAIAEMCGRAFAYVDGRLDARGGRVAPDSEFAMICTLWPEFTLSEHGRRTLEATLAHVEATWRSATTFGKAADVLILKGNGHDAAAARVFGSLRQFGVVRAGQGLCFPSVDDIRAYATIIRAYSAMGAPRADLDAMRQWITVQAQASDDIFAYNPDYVISSVLLTGSDWTSAPLAFGVLVDNEPLESTAQERATGYTVATLSPSGPTMRIEIRPNGATPSYGSVVSVGKRTLATVEARPGRDVAITKRFLVNRDGQWVETTAFRLGERVRVQLTLEVGRAMDYVAITDRRAATMAPVDQLPGYVYSGALGLYRENGDESTNLFVSHLPAGTYHLTYDMTANNVGRFISGTATLQSQYAPELTAHSSGCYLTVE